MSDRVTRIVAWVVALTANVLIGYYLMWAMRPLIGNPATTSQRTTLVWISRSVPEVRPEAVRSIKAVPRSTRNPKPAERGRKTSVQVNAAASVSGGETVAESSTAIAGTAADDRWGQHEPDGQQGSLDFRRNILARNPRPMLPTVERVRFNLQDRSLGGRLQSMTRASICRDLRRALTASPESTRTILESMKSLGCRGS